MVYKSMFCDVCDNVRVSGIHKCNVITFIFDLVENEEWGDFA